MIFVKVYLQIIGKHFYPGAEEEVKFLREPHLHNFEIYCYFRVGGFNREKEFYKLREEVLGVLEPFRDGHIYKFRTMSCEEIAKYLYENLEDCFLVEVLEDNKCGGGYGKFS